jgi:hypothetical protein
MKKFKSIKLIAAVILFAVIMTGCAKEEVKITSDAGALYLMFSEFVENKVDLKAYKYLSFDKESTGLEGEDLELLEEMIKEYCKENGNAYLDMDKTRLRRALMISTGAKGQEFTNGYLLSFSNCQRITDDEGNVIFQGEIYFWHGDFDLVGGLNFSIIKTDKGWYIDRDLENGGYDFLVS